MARRILAAPEQLGGTEFAAQVAAATPPDTTPNPPDDGHVPDTIRNVLIDILRPIALTALTDAGLSVDGL